jgi:serine/threonine protein kinase
MKPNYINRTFFDDQQSEGGSKASDVLSRGLNEALDGLSRQGLPAEGISQLGADLEKLSVKASHVLVAYFSKAGSSNRVPQGHSKIQTTTGNQYELLNTLSESDTDSLQRQCNQLWRAKAVIAEGAFGKVRFARNLNTDEIVAVKKIASVLNEQGQLIDNKTRSIHEIKQMQLIQDRIVQRNAWSMLTQFALPLDHAHLVRPLKVLGAQSSEGSARPVGNKSYIFSEYASLGDGLDASCRVQELMEQGKVDDAKQLFLHCVRSYAKAVRDLHGLGLHHRDIKPENFLHYGGETSNDQEQIKLTDFGFTHDEEYKTQWAGETSIYAPPECKPGYRATRYDAEAHDSFSLGLTLWVLRDQGYPHKKPSQPHLHLKTRTGQMHELTLKFYRNLGEPVSEKVRCSGVAAEHLANLDMNHFDNILAKLIAANKTDRMSAEQAYSHLSALPPGSITL